MKKIFLWIDTNKLSIILSIVIIVMYVISWNRGITLLYLITALSLATLIISFILPYFNLLGLNISIKHPEVTYEGAEIPISITLTSSNFFNRYFLEIWWNATFSHDNNYMFFITTLHKKEVFNIKLLCDVRGEHKIGPLSIQTGFPLGIKFFNKIFEDTLGEVLVLPRFVPIHRFSFGVDELSIFYGNNRVDKKGGNDDFVSIREYKVGDSPRHIHWPASAKQDELMVREYQDSLSPRLIIVLDLHKNYTLGKGKDTTLEYAITIATSLAIYSLDKGYKVSLFGYGKKKIELVDIVGSHNKMEILESLAYAKCDGEANYEETIRDITAFNQSGTLVLFGKGDGQLNTQMDAYSSRLFKPVLFDIRSKSFLEDVFNKNFTLEDTHKQSIYTLQKGCDIDRLFR